ncbi:phosphotransferase [Methylophaga sp.]|uniref:aminoglycoside phosphotransferase family protein n=1 Tax=Methylophaga sp. TaxID=2024840 RepID=UPI0013FFD505|nr:phosphotransferase [Methylophaga sp.]MTI64739.1 aminoglycoside phosphotransferase [Methylophaga sp.]
MKINSDSDPRLSQLEEWLTAVLPYGEFKLEVASSDASFRRYFRVYQHEHSRIVMDAPPEHEDIDSFISIAEFLAGFDIHVPRIFAKNREQGFLLLSDLGNTSYLSALNEHSADPLYRAAIDEIIKMQLAPTAELELTAYDDEKLRDEMKLFPDWFLEKHLSLTPPPELDFVFDQLISNAIKQPQYFVHRDYHSRNLMLGPDNEVGVIDFQDAVIGPATYDLVSLLKDCYIQWPQSRLDSWLDYYFEQATDKRLLSEVDRSTFIRWFDWMGLQRHLKVLGIFCRLNYRDGKAGYMNDLPLTLNYVLQVTGRYPELASLHQFLTQSPTIMAIK